MAELFLSAFLDVLFDKLASPGVLKFVRQHLGGVESEITKWESNFIMIQAVLGDAEERQLTSTAVELWLDDLRDLAYDAEDILDEFSTKALERMLRKQHDHEALSSKIQRLVPSCFSPSTVKFNATMLSRIKEITSRLAGLCEQRNALGLQLIPPGGTSSAAAAQQRLPSSSVRTEREVYGRDDDKAKILKMVLTDTPSDHANVDVIPIVGTGGIGKTTLAREVYNDKAVKDSRFDVKAWVCVSDVFDVLGISKALLESINSATSDLKTLNEVQVRLKTAVDGKKILVVLDDVWNEDHDLWEVLKAPFLAAAPNSKIIVTTRHSNVANTMKSIQQYNLQHLSDQDCWSLFMMHAESPVISAHQISDQIREKVVGKCKGLPLAAKTLGGLLYSKRLDAWDEILNSNILHLPEQNGILSVLRLSYHYLPSHLKRCFAYCAIFPKDYEFEKNELVFLWMAEGLIQQLKEDKQPEEWGRECFEDLVSRSIVEKSSVDSSKFVMHDLVHDLAQLVSGETIFKLEEANNSSRRLGRVRHSSYNRDDYDVKNKFEALHDVEHLRTFLPISIAYWFTSYITSMFLSELLPKFKKLRVLSLEGYYITELPNSIGGLRLLRYLNLAGTAVISLPESISSMLNLQILILRDCNRLKKLPTKMRNLINLRHLDIKGAKLLKEMPLGMKELKNIRMLSNFIVGKGDTVSGLKDLKNLKFIGGEICISGLENVKNSKDAWDAALREKQNLEAVSLKWVSQSDVPRNEVDEEHVLDMLQPHKNMKVLTVKYYVGARFPQWIGDPSFSKMEALILENCENCTALPSLGLLGSLKNLIIKGMKKLRSVGSEFYGKDCSKSFPSLEALCFKDLQEWECWDINSEENGLVAGFSSLRELYIVECPKLSGKLPEQLPSLETLVVDNCSELIVSFSSYPMLCKLKINDCKGLVCSTLIDSKLIESMTISNSSLQVYGFKGMMHNDCTAAVSRSQVSSVTITNILEFGKFLKQGFQQVKTLWIGDSQQIESWRRDDRSRLRKKPEQRVHVVTFPDEASIEECCASLVPFPEINFFPKKLRSLKIGQCRTLKSLPEQIIGSNSKLESLYIRDCDSLTFIGRRKLPSSLKRLEINNCKILRRLVDGEEDASSSSSIPSPLMLKHLEISLCPELISLSSGIQLLDALEELVILDCPKLVSLPDDLHKLICLKRISIGKCPSIVSFPERGLPNTISRVHINDCEKLEHLPNEIQKLNSLDHLSIIRCASIDSFPEEGFPTNIKSLCIGNAKLYKALIEWGLHRLTSLTELTIVGCDDVECFPDEEILPASLTDLHLSRLLKLKCLSSTGFQSLNSLKALSICVCPNLTSFPEPGLPSSLLELSISDCPNLTSFPEAGLPSSLLELSIYDCPKLKKECKRDKGKEWSKIAHIPEVEIDGKFIYDPEEK